MPTYTESNASRAPFVADRDSLVHDSGHTIDWANVPVGTYGDAGSQIIPAGTRMAKGPGVGLIPRSATAPAIGVLATDAHQKSASDAASGYGLIKGGLLYENLLPGAAGSPAVIAAAEKTELNTAGVGTGFGLVQYADSTTA